MSKKAAEPVRPRVSCFSACFGVVLPDPDAGAAAASKSGKRKRRWLSSLSWSRFRKKAAAARKTVPVDAPIADPKAGDPWCLDRGRKAKYGSKKVQYHEPKKPPDTSAPAKPDPCHKPARKSDPKRADSRPCSPEDGRARTAARGRPASQQPRPPASSRTEVAGKYDPLVGMSILVVALAIVLVWGRVCAIVCTAAWLYFVPRLRPPEKPTVAAVANAASVTDAKNLESEEYKKKVVLEGLLERSHRNPSAAL